jgi:hypothetical protein
MARRTGEQEVISENQIGRPARVVGRRHDRVELEVGERRNMQPLRSIRIIGGK